MLPPARIARLPLRNRIGAEISTAPAGPVAISSRPRLAPPRLLVISGASTDSRSLALRVTLPPASAPVTTEAFTVASPLAPLAPPTEPGGAAGGDDAQGGRVEQPGATVAVGCGDADVGAVGDAQVDLCRGLHQAAVAALGAAAREDPPVHAGIAVDQTTARPPLPFAGSRDVDAGALGQRRRSSLVAARRALKSPPMRTRRLCGRRGRRCWRFRQGHLLPADQHVATVLRPLTSILPAIWMSPDLLTSAIAASRTSVPRASDHADRLTALSTTGKPARR